VDSAIGVARSSYRSRGSFVLAATGGRRHLEERISGRRASWWTTRALSAYRRFDPEEEVSETDIVISTAIFARAREIGASRGPRVASDCPMRIDSVIDPTDRHSSNNLTDRGNNFRKGEEEQQSLQCTRETSRTRVSLE